MEENTPASKGTSNDTKTIVTVVLLVLAYPIGVILMVFWAHWPKWLKLTLSLPFILIALAIFGLTALGSHEKKAPTPQPAPVVTVVVTASPTPAPKFIFDVPTLVGKDLDGITKDLGTPKGLDVTAQQIALGVKEWDKTYTINGHDLLVTYTISNKKVVDFFVDTEDPSGKTKDKARLLEITNTNMNDPRYTVEFVKVINDPSSFTGIKITPK